MFQEFEDRVPHPMNVHVNTSTRQMFVVEDGLSISNDSVTPSSNNAPDEEVTFSSVDSLLPPFK
jgi:hypothetical protein